MNEEYTHTRVTTKVAGARKPGKGTERLNTTLLHYVTKKNTQEYGNVVNVTCTSSTGMLKRTQAEAEHKLVTQQCAAKGLAWFRDNAHGKYIFFQFFL